VDANVGAGDVLRTGADGRLALELADRLSLRLNVDTELVFADAANVELTAGTIYVDSGEGGADTALEVVTPFGSVEHLGTQYEVRFDDASLRVRVREGAIAFTGAGAGQTGTAGEQLDFDADGLTARSAIAPDDEAWAWATGLASLPESDAHSVVETLAWIARESGLTLEFEPAGSAQRLARESLVGLSGLNPEETLSVIERTTDLNLEIGNGILLVTN
jgi:ferric-dicitrate binding protein FerR (iron transport regulator)